MTLPLIHISGLTKIFEQRRFLRPALRYAAVDDVSLKILPGTTLGIVGESGSGKSTLLRMLLRLIRPTAGTIIVGGEEIGELAGGALKAFRRQVQPIFQNPASSFNPRQRIGAILRAPLEVHGIGDRRTRTERAIQLLERVGLGADIADRFPHQLSGGQKQRIAIARAIILQPSIVLADEPTSALDVSVQAQVLELFSEVRSEMGLTCVFVSHNLAVIQQVADSVAVMQSGKVVEYGATDAVFSAPQHPHTRALIEAAMPDPFRSAGRSEGKP